MSSSKKMKLQSDFTAGVYQSWLNLHRPPEQPQFKTKTSCRGGWQSPYQCWSLPLRSWPWNRPNQGVMTLFIYLFLDFAPHEIIKRLIIWWAVGPHSIQLVIHQVCLQQVLGVHNNRYILRVRTLLSVVLAVCLLILIKNFHQKRKW